MREPRGACAQGLLVILVPRFLKGCPVLCESHPKAPGPQPVSLGLILSFFNFIFRQTQGEKSYETG